jgi:hypothetical protein
MPARSQAQRELLNARFGHAWVKDHHFDNKGKLPARAPKGRSSKSRSDITREQMIAKFARKHRGR